MRVPLSWLQSHFRAPLPPAEVLAAALTGAGIEVEDTSRHAPGFDLVVTGRIVKVDPHPNADRLRICQTDLGSDETTQIVTGAANVQLGDIVPVALPGAHLPGGTKIQPSKLRGVESGGMYCSLRELSLEGGVDGVEILPPGTPLGVPVASVLGVGDLVLTLSILANRPDLMSIRGVAREVSALGLGDLISVPSVDVQGQPTGEISVTVEDAATCSRYLAVAFDDVQVADSPAWLRDRLAAAGVRSISNVVDITNHVMLEWGHPLHAFDRDRLSGEAVQVRLARSGERLVTLDGQDRVLDPSQLVIADAAGPVALAGIMGGAHSGVASDTRRVVLEVAAFDPALIRRTSRALALHSESSQRFSRGVDPATLGMAAAEAVRLFETLAGARRVGDVTEVGGAPVPGAPVRFERSKVASLLGADLLDDSVVASLGKLGFTLSSVEADIVECSVPSWRAGDVRRSVDLLEEIARFRGYEAIPSEMLPPRPAASLGIRERLRRRLRDTCEGQGLQDIVSSSLVPAAQANSEPDGRVMLVNALAGFEALRSGLWRGLLEALAYNDRQRARRVGGYYEIGWSHRRDEGQSFDAREELAFAFQGEQMSGSWQAAPDVLQGDFSWAAGFVRRVLDDLRIEGLTVVPGAPSNDRHPGRSAQLLLDGRELGQVFELHPAFLMACDASGLGRVTVGWLDVGELQQSQKRLALSTYRAFSRQPAVTRDLALRISDDVLAGVVLNHVREVAGPLLEEVRCFDRYVGSPLPAGQASLGLRLTFRGGEQTLTDEDIEPVMAAILARVADRTGGTVRDGQPG